MPLQVRQNLLKVMEDGMIMSSAHMQSDQVQSLVVLLLSDQQQVLHASHIMRTPTPSLAAQKLLLYSYIPAKQATVC